MGVTNPKTIVFFAAVLPQFVETSAEHIWMQLLILGTIFEFIAVISDGTYAYVAGTARAWFGRSPRRLEYMGGGGGLMMSALGVALAFTRHKN